MWDYLKLRYEFYKIAMSYPVPSNVNMYWNFGLISFFFLLLQIISGIFLGMHYVPDSKLANDSIEHIMNDVTLGWFVRYIHSNGASFFFLMIYVHICRGLYYNSYLYPRTLIWISGVIILLTMIITSFLGYVLPWGQMSYWAAIVITSLATAFPWIGDEIIVWLWGGFSVSNPTLNRFLSLHYMLPVVIMALVIAHVGLLHCTESTNPLGVLSNADSINFGIFFIIKDILWVCLVVVIGIVYLHYNPEVLSHPDNNIKANPLVTPNHIVPEWYFLPFYAILRSVPDKLVGVMLLLGSIIVLLFLPFYTSTELRNFGYRPLLRTMAFLFIVNFIILGWIGSKEVISPYYEIGQLATAFYFGYFLAFLPLAHIKINKAYFKQVNKKK